jgi:hypothetical protein
MAEQQSPQAIFRPATIQIGPRTFAIETRPLATSADQYRQVELVQPAPDCMVIEPKRRAFGAYLLPYLLAAVGAALAPILNVVLEVPYWVGFGVLLLVLAAYVFVVRQILSSLRWIRFDRRAGLMTVQRKVGFRRRTQTDRTRQLSEVVAVQLLYEGYHSEDQTISDGPGGTLYHRFNAYQFNLIIDDPKEPRFHVTSHSDWQWMRQAGQRLADFLKVPLVDQLSHGS